MAITFKQLILAAPFPEDRKKALIENIDKMTEDQKYRLTNLAWKVLAQMYFAQLRAERQLIMDEVVHDKRKLNPNDFEELEAKLIFEFAQKLEAVESKESIEEVKKQLEKFLPVQADKFQPLPQDKTTSFPSQKP